MACYRLYVLHGFSGHIVRYDDFESPSDWSAIHASREHAGAQPMELWCDHRKVHRFEAQGDARRAQIGGFIGKGAEAVDVALVRPDRIGAGITGH